MNKYRLFLAHFAIIIVLGGQAGCAVFKNMGSFEPSTSATLHFESFTVNNNYQYYLSGSDVYPLAIFGLHKDYIIDSDPDLWKRIEAKQNVIAELVSNIQKKTLECCLERPHGFDILDNNGKKIGEWYSMLSIKTGIKVKEDHKVIIYAPLDSDRDVKRYQGRTDEKS